MNQENLFTIVGIRPLPKAPPVKKAPKKRPYFSMALLCLLILICLLCELLMTKDPSYFHLDHCNQSPNREFLFGTDSLGRDIFSCILYGGRISLLIGFLATAISTIIAVIYGSVSGISKASIDSLLMRVTEIALSIPNLLVILFVQAIFGKPNILSISLVIGITSWCAIAKVVRTEVRQLRNAEYVVASRCMGGSFFHILRRHLAPNFISAIMFMVVMNVQSAISAESTLSFMGMGLPLDSISLGSILSLADNALLTKSWWIIVFPGVFLVILLMCMTTLGNYLRQNLNQKESHL